MAVMNRCCRNCWVSKISVNCSRPSILSRWQRWTDVAETAECPRFLSTALDPASYLGGSDEQNVAETAECPRFLSTALDPASYLGGSNEQNVAETAECPRFLSTALDPASYLGGSDEQNVAETAEYPRFLWTALDPASKWQWCQGHSKQNVVTVC